MPDVSQDLLSDLNPSQREAVTHPGGPLLVVAGAGTGKTKVITRRIAWQVGQGVFPASILAITFTNKAAGEMAQRVNALVPGRGVWLSTFHSMGARVLRIHADRLGYAPEFTIYDQGDRYSLLKQVLKDLELDPAQFTPSMMGERISRAKDSLIGPEAFSEESAGDPVSDAAAKTYRLYQKRLLAQNAMDFDDLLMNLHLLWTEHPDVLTAYRERFTQVLVDEYQDTNRVQYQLVLLLAGQHRNLCATGDPDQSIYTWRGADLRNILDFQKDFPEAKVVRLEQNYRSTKTILAAASAMIRRNKLRIERGLWTENDPGERISVWTCADERDEADRIAAQTERLHSAGIAWSGMAVLYRQNALSRSLEQAMLRLRIPHQVVGATAFYDRKEIKDALAYAVLAVNPKADVALQRVVNVPPRGIGKTTLTHLVSEANRSGEPMVSVFARANGIPGLAKRSAEAAQILARLLGDLQALAGESKSVSSTLRKILEATGYLKYLGGLEPSEARERSANVLELVSAAAEYDTDHPEDGSLLGFLESVALLSDADTHEEDQDTVSLMTLHAAKGLEFPHVFLAGLEDGLLPHAMSKSGDEDLEEERRLFYVGLTRAMKHVVITWAQGRVTYGQYQVGRPSPFLDELPGEALDGYPPKPQDLPAPSYGILPRRGSWGKPNRDEEAVFEAPPKDFDDEMPAVGTGLLADDRVRHPTFGEGRVEAISGSGRDARVRVRFKAAGVKTLILGYANLEKVAE